MYIAYKAEKPPDGVKPFSHLPALNFKKHTQCLDATIGMGATDQH